MTNDPIFVFLVHGQIREELISILAPPRFLSKIFRNLSFFPVPGQIREKGIFSQNFQNKVLNKTKFSQDHEFIFFL